MSRCMVFAVALVLVAGAASAQQQVEERHPASKNGRVEIQNSNGSIKVIGWERDEVTVSGKLGQGADGLDFESSKGGTEISVSASGNPHAAHADLEIHVPAGSRLEIDGFAARISVSNVTGAINAETVNGSIHVSGASKDVEATSVNGTVEVEGRCSRVHAESVNGIVTVRGTAQTLEASTVNGGVVIQVDRTDHAELETVSGPLQFSGVVTNEGSLTASSVSGSVEMTLGSGQNATIEASTFSGQIDAGQSPVTSTRVRHRSKYTSQKDMEFLVGKEEGAAAISINTLSGSVTIKADGLVSKDE